MGVSVFGWVGLSGIVAWGRFARNRCLGYSDQRGAGSAMASGPVPTNDFYVKMLIDKVVSFPLFLLSAKPIPLSPGGDFVLRARGLY